MLPSGIAWFKVEIVEKLDPTFSSIFYYFFSHIWKGGALISFISSSYKVQRQREKSKKEREECALRGSGGNYFLTVWQRSFNLFFSAVVIWLVPSTGSLVRRSHITACLFHLVLFPVLSSCSIPPSFYFFQIYFGWKATVLFSMWNSKADTAWVKF